MKGALWSLVAAFTIVLQVAAEITVQPIVDIPKLAGRWRAHAVVVDRGEVKSTLRYRAYVELKKNGDVFVTKMFPKGTNCEESKVYLKPTDHSGIFQTASQSSTLRVVITDYYDYCIFHIESPLRNELHLYLRKRYITNDAKDMFETATKMLGFDKDKIVYRTKTGKCS
ncbi:hypothetical protein lerEdw1_014344 [Lerista edwardsae]|nr:hypothetical protein lerEdw1_014346 [Lerista edwardsae]KAJ6633643.1 hypothetical protein lerEdw1_014344 [Lerista edwardsae]